jgi:CDP-glycerol glycerophosphotransferase (TagB/SpsB family)/glycosyltransferase involved in cell wall biosynthesis
MSRRLIRAFFRVSSSTLSPRLKSKLRRSAHPVTRARLAALLVPQPRDHGRLSVIVPAFNVEPYLTECLASLVAQSYRNLEIILVDDGSEDGSLSIAKDFARRDRRIRVLAVPHGGNGRARNFGVGHARGKYITFADADDVVAPGAYSRLVSTLAASGSDFAVGAYDRYVDGRKQPVRVSCRTHAVDRIGITVADFPEILDDVFLWNKVFTRTFWNDSVGKIPEGVVYEDQETTARAYLRSASFDVLSDIVYSWRLRDDGSSLTQNKGSELDLKDRLLVAQAVSDLMEREAPSVVAIQWFRRLLGADLVPYFEQLPQASDAYWGSLKAGIEHIFRLMRRMDDLGPLVLKSVGPHEQALIHLTLQASRHDVESEIVARAEHGTGFRLVARDEGFFAPTGEAGPCAGDGLSKLVEVPSSALTFVSKVRAAGLTREGHLILRGFAYLEGLDSGSSCLDIRLSVRLPGLPSTDLPVTRESESFIDVRANDAYASHAASAFSACVPRDLLEAAPEEICVEVRLTTPAQDFASVHAIEQLLRRPGLAITAPAVCRLDVDPSANHITVAVEPRTKSVESAADFDICLATKKNTMRPSSSHLGRDGLRYFVFDLATNRWGDTLKSPESGAYTLRYAMAGTLPGPRSIPLAAGAFFDDRLAHDFSGPYASVTAWITESGSVAVNIGPPLSSLERSRYGQKLLQTSYQAQIGESVAGNGILFESFGGSVCSDSPRAISDAVAAQRSDVPLYWSIKDYSVAYPRYATPVVRGSADWYRVLREAAVLVNNNNFPPYFRKAAHQKYIQTWHGTPLKRVGRDAPKHSLSELYRSIMEREAGYWDVLLAQNRYAAETLSGAFGFGGDVVVAGYPRNDSLFSQDRDAVRNRVRELLGIKDETRAILYAPTWRDNARDALRHHKMANFLDYGLLQKKLGDDYVVLLRGHHTVERGDDFDQWPGVLDVTGYPEVNDLFLASDMLVTDYSSIFFDYSLTDKPIYFLVPDLEAYRDEIRGLYMQLRGVAPGPLCSSTDQLIASILDAENSGARIDYRSFRERFGGLDHATTGYTVARILGLI